MSTIRTLTPVFAVSPAPEADFFKTVAAEGFTLVINNRPDGEDPTQLSSAQAQAAAQSAGLAYVHIPVTGTPGPAQAEAMRAALADASGPVLAFCRSGTRSAGAYCLAQAMRGANIADTLASARNAGYDLAGLEPLMRQLQQA